MWTLVISIDNFNVNITLFVDDTRFQSVNNYVTTILKNVRKESAVVVFCQFHVLRTRVALRPTAMRGGFRERGHVNPIVECQKQFETRLKFW